MRCHRLRIAFGTVLRNVVTVQGEGGIGNLVTCVKPVIELLYCKLALLRCVGIRNKGGSGYALPHPIHLACSRTSRSVRQIVYRKATGLIRQTIDHLNGAVLIEVTVFVVFRQIVFGRSFDVIAIFAILGKGIAIALIVFRQLFCPRNSGLAISDALRRCGAIHALNSVATVFGFSYDQVAPSNRITLLPCAGFIVRTICKPALQVHRDIRQINIIEAIRHVCPVLFALCKIGIGNPIVQGAVFADCVYRTTLPIFAYDFGALSRCNLITCLVPLDIAWIFVIGAEGIPRIIVVKVCR